MEKKMENQMEVGLMYGFMISVWGLRLVFAGLWAG